MSPTHWLAAFSAIFAALLILESYTALRVIDATNYLLANAGGPYADNETLEMARSIRPALFVVAMQGVLFGILTLVMTVAILRRKAWAHYVLLLWSVGLVATASAVIVMAPHQWVRQGCFIALCATFWCWRLLARKAPSAP